MDEQNVIERDLLEMDTDVVGFIQVSTDEFPSHWRQIQLGEIIASGPKNGAYKPLSYYGQGTPILRIDDFGNGGSVVTHVANRVQLSESEINEYRLSPNDIIVNRVNSLSHLGKAALVGDLEEPTIFESNMMRFAVNSGVALPEYVFQLLNSPTCREQIKQKAKRAVAQSSINQNDVKSIIFLLPPLPEQRAIARTLHTVQEAIQTRRREMELERERKAALMQHLFTFGTRGEPIKLTEIGEMPESWGVARLDSRANLITKGSSPNWQGFEYRKEGIVFVRSQNIGWARLELDDIAYLPEEFNKKERKSIIRENDLLVNIVGASIGRAALANAFVAGGNLNQAVAIARLQKDSEPGFVMYFLLTEHGQTQLHRQKKDVARANLSLQDIGNVLIPWPSPSEQREITSILLTCERKITALEQEIRLLEELFRALLEELMTGRLSALPLVAAEVVR